MPIRPQYRWLYPIDWVQLSAEIRFKRADGRCENCRRPHGQDVLHLGDGRWWDDRASNWRDRRGIVLSQLKTTPVANAPGVRSTRVYLATAHLDHDPTNNHPRNLRALCQRCHMINDALEHRLRRRQTLRARKALGDLFLGPYAAL